MAQPSGCADLGLRPFGLRAFHPPGFDPSLLLLSPPFHVSLSEAKIPLEGEVRSETFM